VGVNAGRSTQRMTKKHPTYSALDRARSLRRDMTDAEKKLWEILRGRGIAGFDFRRQVPIGPYITDFLCHKARIIIEAEGGQHDLTSQREMTRTAFLNGEGYRVLRFWNNEVLSSLDGVYETISSALDRVSPPPNPPPSRGRALGEGNGTFTPSGGHAAPLSVRTEALPCNPCGYI
jgi:very-short-patch-repair endonuclease